MRIRKMGRFVGRRLEQCVDNFEVTRPAAEPLGSLVRYQRASTSTQKKG